MPIMLDIPAFDVEAVAVAIASVSAVVLLIYKKFKDIKGASIAKETAELISGLGKERAEAVKERDKALDQVDSLREKNGKLENQIADLKLELLSMRDRVKLLAELNNRLQRSLQEVQDRLQEYAGHSGLLLSAPSRKEEFFGGVVPSSPAPLTELGKELLRGQFAG